jgi:hypothetical protein
MPAPSVIRFGAFSPCLPHLLAMREGYYSARGLHVEQCRIPSSPALRDALRDNDLDVVLTSPDNIRRRRDSGFAFLLYELLRQRGLSRDDDYSVAEIGGTPGRFEELIRAPSMPQS